MKKGLIVQGHDQRWEDKRRRKGLRGMAEGKEESVKRREGKSAGLEGVREREREGGGKSRKRQRKACMIEIL